MDSESVVSARQVRTHRAALDTLPGGPIGCVEGDQLLRDACAIICEVFKHSPVFRVAGDEFAAVAQGHDYENADELEAELKETSRRNRETGGTVIACGMAKYDGKSSVASVFARAEERCREE